MRTSDLVKAATQGLLDRPKAAARSGRRDSEIWCSVMDVVDKSERRASSPVIDPVCGKLRALFDGLAHTPMPDQLELLAEQLDAALERGELTGPKTR